MSATEPPAAAAWRHHDARDGFEVAFFSRAEDGRRVRGAVTAVEEREAWAVSYDIELDTAWATRRARVRTCSEAGEAVVTVERTAQGWLVDGAPAPWLDGCADVDLEVSAMTNAFPVNRLRLAVDERAAAPAAWVRLDLRVERLVQTYRREPTTAHAHHYEYTAPDLEARYRLTYDDTGLVLTYPGLASRHR